MSRNSFPMKPLIGANQLPVVQNITTGAASAAAANPVGPQTYAVQLNATAGVWVVFAPTLALAVATAANGFLIKASDYAVVMGIPPGYYIGAIQQSANGTLNILELTH